MLASRGARRAGPLRLTKLDRDPRRSRAADGEPTAWARTEVWATTPPATVGIRVVTLDRGYRHDVAQTSPWLLQGAKTLSYAVNRARCARPPGAGPTTCSS